MSPALLRLKLRKKYELWKVQANQRLYKPLKPVSFPSRQNLFHLLHMLCKFLNAFTDYKSLKITKNDASVVFPCIWSFIALFIEENA